jgi:catalase
MKIPINCPYKSKVSNRQRDGPIRVDGNQGSSINYEPNSMGLNRSNTFFFNRDFRYEPYRITGLVARHRPNHPMMILLSLAFFSAKLWMTRGGNLQLKISPNICAQFQEIFKKGLLRISLNQILNMERP